MTGAQTLLLVLAIGVPLLVVAAVVDRTARRRAEAELAAPPDRGIPGLDASLSGAPAYVGVEDAVSRRVDMASLTAEQEHHLTAQLRDAVEVPAGWPDARFATHSSPDRALLHDPLVLCVLDTVGSIRELVTPLDLANRAGRPFVVVAPHIDADTLETLLANRLVLRSAQLAVVAAVAHVKAIAAAVGAQPTTQVDLQSGWLPAEVWGRSEIFLTDAATTLIRPGRPNPQPTGEAST